MAVLQHTSSPLPSACIVRELTFCSQANNHLDSDTWTFTSDCDQTTYCDANATCAHRGCRRDTVSLPTVQESDPCTILQRARRVLCCALPLVCETDQQPVPRRLLGRCVRRPPTSVRRGPVVSVLKRTHKHVSSHWLTSRAAAPMKWTTVSPRTRSEDHARRTVMVSWEKPTAPASCAMCVWSGANTVYRPVCSQFQL